MAVPSPIRHNLWIIGWAIFVLGLALTLGVLL